MENPFESGIVEGTGTYDEGETVMITAEPNFGFAFASWSEADTVYAFSSDTLVVISGERTLTSNFSPVYSIQLFAEPSDGGVVNGGGVFLTGSETTLSASPNDGYAFDFWTETDTSTSMNSYFSSNSDTTIIVTSNQVYTAIFYPSTAIQNTSNLLFSIYPNPVHSILYFKTTGPENQILNITLKNASGKEQSINYLYRNDAAGGSIDLSELEQGIYYLTIRSNDEQTTRKIVKM